MPMMRYLGAVAADANETCACMGQRNVTASGCQPKEDGDECQNARPCLVDTLARPASEGFDSPYGP